MFIDWVVCFLFSGCSSPLDTLCPKLTVGFELYLLRLSGRSWEEYWISVDEATAREFRGPQVLFSERYNCKGLFCHFSVQT